MKTGRRKSMLIKTKLEIQKKIENGASKKDTGNEYGINKSVISRIRGNKENYEQFATQSMKLPACRKQLQNRIFENIENTLYK